VPDCVETAFIPTSLEAPNDIYIECLTRTMTTNGIIWLTFTPLQGLTEVVLRFQPAVVLE
jgi:phage terminase large subunit-like protein